MRSHSIYSFSRKGEERDRNANLTCLRTQSPCQHLERSQPRPGATSQLRAHAFWLFALEEIERLLASEITSKQEEYTSSTRARAALSSTTTDNTALLQSSCSQHQITRSGQRPVSLLAEGTQHCIRRTRGSWVCGTHIHRLGGGWVGLGSNACGWGVTRKTCMRLWTAPRIDDPCAV